MAFLDVQGDVCVLQGNFEKTLQESQIDVQQRKAEKEFEDLNMDEFEMPDDEEQASQNQ